MRLFIFIALLLIAPAIAGIYGFIHDQITFAVSEEFFTKLRFLEFDLPDNWPPSAKAGVIGIANAMKAGIPFGIVLTAIGKIHKKDFHLLNYTIYAYLLTCLMSFVFTILALYMPLAPQEVREVATMPADILDPIAFQRVILMNNYGYVGGIIGMFMGIGLQIFFYKKNLKKEALGNPKA